MLIDWRAIPDVDAWNQPTKIKQDFETQHCGQQYCRQVSNTAEAN
jgi:hypothetical protein